MPNKNTIVRHHLLEIILWPNEDGTFITINNSRDRLKELGIYNDFKMTIPMTQSEHNTLHHKGKPAWNKGKAHSDETRAKITAALIGRTSPMCGKKFSDEHKAKISAAMKGKPTWNKGKTHNDETRAKMSAARKIYWENRRKMKEENHG